MALSKFIGSLPCTRLPSTCMLLLYETIHMHLFTWKYTHVKPKRTGRSVGGSFPSKQQKSLSDCRAMLPPYSWPVSLRAALCGREHNRRSIPEQHHPTPHPSVLPQHRGSLTSLSTAKPACLAAEGLVLACSRAGWMHNTGAKQLNSGIWWGAR